MTWTIRVLACLVGALFIVYLYKNASPLSQFVARQLSRPEAQDYHREEYAWVLLVVVLIVVAVLCFPFVFDLIVKAVGGAETG